MTPQNRPAKRVFITGASSGLGAALAKRYAAQGAVLGLAARRRDMLQQLAATLPNAVLHRVYDLDVTDHGALATAAADFITATGGVEVVIANAGVSAGTLTECAEDLAPFERIIATNVTATVARTPQEGYACESRLQGNSCGDCRACWDPSVGNVVYTLH